MNQYFTQAIFLLYPQIAYIRGDEAFDIENNLVQYDSVAVQEEADKLLCSDQAKAILTATDWTQMADSSLVNKADFTAYRAAIRTLARHPVANAVFPELPIEQWN